MKINSKLKSYIEKNILPLYDNNFIGDGRDRVDYVIKRSQEIIEENKLDVDNNILYTVISYHDIRKSSEEKEHEIISAEIMDNDEFLKTFFSKEDRTVIKEAIEDQRASLKTEPRNIYGKILSSASRNSSVEQCLERSYCYGKKKNPNATDDEIFEGAYEALLKKFGKNGYAKFYFKDSTYEKFLEDIRKLLSDKNTFIKKQREYIETMKINKELKKYIEENVFPVYEKNDFGHSLDHIKYVIERSLKFAKEVENINYDMVYAIAAYHDIGHHIDAKNHEKVSAEMLLADNNLKKFFSDEEIKIMSEAVHDHRASMDGEPRSIYGKIVSSADRNTSIDIPLIRTYSYRVEHNPEYSLDEIIEESREHLINKYGKKGYAAEKMYFEDLDYKKFLEDIVLLTQDKEKFRERFLAVNNINM